MLLSTKHDLNVPFGKPTKKKRTKSPFYMDRSTISTGPFSSSQSLSLPGLGYIKYDSIFLSTHDSLMTPNSKNYVILHIFVQIWWHLYDFTDFWRQGLFGGHGPPGCAKWFSNISWEMPSAAWEMDGFVWIDVGQRYFFMGKSESWTIGYTAATPWRKVDEDWLHPVVCCYFVRKLCHTLGNGWPPVTTEQSSEKRTSTWKGRTIGAANIYEKCPELTAVWEFDAYQISSHKLYEDLHQPVSSVQNPGWLMISLGILLPNILGFTII